MQTACIMFRRKTGGRVILGVVGASLLLACASPGTRPPAALSPMHRDDALWLQSVTFGLDSATVSDYQHLGRSGFLERQLAARDVGMPAAIATQIASLDAAQGDPAARLAEVMAQRKVIGAMADGPERVLARKTLYAQGNELALDAIRRELLSAVYSPAQLQEQMVWFWLNHFSVHRNKAAVRWLVGDYAQHAVRPHALGKFKDLVMATLQHPAMLQYLDNDRNAAGHLNENYAREIMELHTLGVGAGYTQADVQTLARILTGVGIDVGPAPQLKPEWARLYVRKGAFEFNPARHDFGAKTLLGHPIQSSGFGEVEEAVALIVRQPACARFIAHELAVYFVSDDPPAALVERMTQTFMHTDGDIAAVLRTMFSAHEFTATLGGKFKDPMRFVLSAVRFAYDGRTLDDAQPMVNWLSGLGEAPFGRPTPDGYPLTEASWASSGQMSRRFDIAHAIGASTIAGGFPQLSNRVYFAAVEPFLGAPTRAALGRATSPQEWNTFLLSSPDFSYE